MRRLRHIIASAALTLMAVIALALPVGCVNQDAPAGAGPAQTSPVVASAAQRSGAQLWADNCSRCHYARPPQSFSETQWEVIVHHMRLRADLTGQEARAITEFLKASD